MRIYYKLSDSATRAVCLTECKYRKGTRVGSRTCQECEHNKGYCKLEKWVDCAKETGMKVETAELQFIRCDEGKRWFAPSERGDYIPFGVAENDTKEVYDTLVANNLLTQPSPLQKALDAVDDIDQKYDEDMNYFIDDVLIDARKIMRTLAEDLQ